MSKLKELFESLKGGPGSGNFGHGGRLGKRGGSTTGGGNLKKANQLLENMSSVDDPISFLKNNGMKVAKVGMSKTSGGDVYKIGKKLGELSLENDKYGRNKYSFSPIDKKDIFEDE